MRLFCIHPFGSASPQILKLLYSSFLLSPPHQMLCFVSIFIPILAHIDGPYCASRQRSPLAVENHGACTSYIPVPLLLHVHRRFPSTSAGSHHHQLWPSTPLSTCRVCRMTPVPASSSSSAKERQSPNRYMKDVKGVETELAKHRYHVHVGATMPPSAVLGLLDSQG